MNKKVKIVIVIAAIALVAPAIILALTRPPSGLSIQASWSDNTSLGSGTLHYECTIINHDNKTARSVQLMITLKDQSNSVIKTETVDVGDIPALGSKDISVDISHSGFESVGKVDAWLTWAP